MISIFVVRVGFIVIVDDYSLLMVLLVCYYWLPVLFWVWVLSDDYKTFSAGHHNGFPN
jgi:hypothetical protein